MTARTLRIALLEPFFTGSHRSWAQNWQRHSRHKIELLTLKGRHWKWRMHGGSVSLAERYARLQYRPDLIIASDMLDLAVFSGLTSTTTATIPKAVYFHENQLSYPWSPNDGDVLKGRDFHYGFINWTTALAADRIYFNSAYNRDSFLKEVRVMLKAMPDQRGLGAMAGVAQKSSVLPLGISLKDLYLPVAGKDLDFPVILWNHRWEYDKNPEAFFQALQRLKQKGFRFRLIVCGKGYEEYPKVFHALRETFSEELLHFGFAETRGEYVSLLRKANLILVTSRQEFFGQSVMEAVAAGCFPLLPDALAYPEHVPKSFRDSVLYSDEQAMDRQLEFACRSLKALLPVTGALQKVAMGYDWGTMVHHYDETVMNDFSFDALV